MGFNSVVWLLIGIFLFLFGLFSVTNITVEWGRPLMGFSALIAGACCSVASESAGPRLDLFLFSHRSFNQWQLLTPPKR